MRKLLFVLLLSLPFIATSGELDTPDAETGSRSDWVYGPHNTWSKEIHSDTGPVLYVITLEKTFQSWHRGIVEVLRLSPCPEGGTQGVKWTYDQETGVSISCNWKKSETIDIPDFFEKGLDPLPPKINKLIEDRRAQQNSMINA